MIKRRMQLWSCIRLWLFFAAQFYAQHTSRMQPKSQFVRRNKLIHGFIFGNDQCADKIVNIE